jgi:hypothetical protein
MLLTIISPCSPHVPYDIFGFVPIADLQNNKKYVLFPRATQYKLSLV